MAEHIIENIKETVLLWKIGVLVKTLSLMQIINNNTNGKQEY